MTDAKALDKPAPVSDAEVEAACKAIGYGETTREACRTMMRAGLEAAAAAHGCAKHDTLDAEAAALVSLVQSNIPPDVQELLVRGDPMRGIAPGALRKAAAAVRGVRG
jgi:hypothetical protein